MTRTTYSLLALAGACAALIAGCGGGSSSSNSSSSKTTAAKSATSSRSSTARSQSTTPTLPSLGSVGGAAASTDCRSALAAAKTLTATERSQFESYCASLKNDTASQLKDALKTVCLEIVKDTVPAADRSLADATCAKL
jgi:hypothetical protein